MSDLAIEAIDRLSYEAWATAEEHGFHDARSRVTEPMRRLAVLALIAEEVGEAVSAVRRGDDDNYEEELADIVIRILDEAECARHAASPPFLGRAIAEKMAKNKKRPFLHGGKSA